MPIHYERDDEHIVLITIDRPERRNALDFPHWRDLSNAWQTFRDDPDAWVAIVTGVESSFCAGADLRDMMNKAVEAVRAAGENGETVDPATMVIDGIPVTVAMEGTLRSLEIYKPIIAAVNGVCVAGGMEIVSGTDIVVACPEATFGLTEPRRGLFAGGGTTARLPRQLPWRHAMEMLLTAERIPAERAKELAIVNEIVPREQLLEKAYDWARRITVNAPLAVQATKESALRGLAAGSLGEAYELEAEIGMKIFATQDAVEGPLAFAEKRDPVWVGR